MNRIDEIGARIHWKVWVVILIVVGLMFLALVFLPMFFGKKTSRGISDVPGNVNMGNNSLSTNPNSLPNPQVTSQVNSTSTPQSTTQKNSLFGLSPSPLPQWRGFADGSFSVNFPSSWSYNKASLDNGGSTWLFHPPFQPGALFPRADVYMYPPNTFGKIDDIINNLTGQGFVKTNVVLSGQPVIKLTQTISGKAWVTGNPDKKDVIKDLYIVEVKDGTLYEIDYSYFVGESDPGVVNSLHQLINTFRINNQP